MDLLVSWLYDLFSKQKYLIIQSPVPGTDDAESPQVKQLYYNDPLTAACVSPYK